MYISGQVSSKDGFTPCNVMKITYYLSGPYSGIIEGSFITRFNYLWFQWTTRPSYLPPTPLYSLAPPPPPSPPRSSSSYPFWCYWEWQLSWYSRLATGGVWVWVTTSILYCPSHELLVLYWKRDRYVCKEPVQLCGYIYKTGEVGCCNYTATPSYLPASRH